MRTITLLIGILLLFSNMPIKSQSNENDIPWSINYSTMIGIGKYNLMDTYLSPGAKNRKYTGPGFRVVNERMKMVRLANYHVSRQQIINVDLAFTENAASTATDLAGFIDYTLGYHYHLPQFLHNLKLLAGGAAHGMLGFIYNTRNGNNPASTKADIDFNLSAMAIYQLHIKNYPMTFRYQFQIPFAGVFFAPHYGQSYYEIFDLGNASGVVQFNSFHNKFAMKNFFTVDFPIRNLTIRAGYLNSSYRSDVNHIQSHIISHSFMLGIVKEFIVFSGKRLKKTHQFKSAYY